MRNLKKTLCLVLALVFVLGLCTVGAVNGTEFDDQEKITYDTAVKAMSGLGILKGDDNDGDGVNSFRPQDNVTRAEAAKIIAYIVVGEDAEKWPARPMFDDVPTDHWAARYIAYCQHNNIINGDGNGKFRPGDKVTVKEFAKMLLACCGYGAKDEFIGAGWDDNVAKVAMQTKILKGLTSVDWDAPASREETAQLGYNTMMNVVRVVLSDDTNSYTNEKVNPGTFGTVTWSLNTAQGMIYRNKSNYAKAEGTYLRLYDNDTSTWNLYPFRADEDDLRADLIGHVVKITWRWETIDGKSVRVAYYIDDECTEVAGYQATKAEVNNGYFRQFDQGDAGATIGSTDMYTGAAASWRAFDSAANKYVLNSDGEIVAYKVGGFKNLPLLVGNDGSKTVQYDNTPGAAAVPVTAPEGAKKGDMLSVYKYGDIYTGVATTKEEGVTITQRAWTEINSTPGLGYFTYNDKVIVPTKALNKGGIAGYLELGQNELTVGGVAKDGTYDLNLNSSYTLYFDAEGGAFAYSDEVANGTAAASAYVWVVADLGYMPNEYNQPTRYFQVIKADGTAAKVAVTADIGDGGTDGVGDGKVIGLGDFTGDTSATPVYATIPANAIFRQGTNRALDYKATFDKTVSTKVQIGQVSYGTDPTMDFTNATFVAFTGNRSTLQTDTTLKPDAGKTIYFTYEPKVVGTTNVKKVQTVWFDMADAANEFNANSYIYTNTADAAEYKLESGNSVPYYAAYKDGTAENISVSRTSEAVKVGFAKYDATSGKYTLQYLVDGNGTDTGARNIYLVDGDTASGNFILNGKLYANGSSKGMDLTDVKIVKVGPAAASFTLPDVSTVNALQAAMHDGYNIKVAFVEVVEYKGASNETHSLGGKVLYVTYMSKNAPET